MKLTHLNVGEVTDGLLASYFDRIVEEVLDEKIVHSRGIIIGMETYRYAHASEDERQAALELFRESRLFYGRSFRAFVTESLDRFDEGLHDLLPEEKAKLIRKFETANGAKVLYEYLADKEGAFNPLFLTHWSDGIAVAMVQNEQLLREDLAVALGNAFRQSGMTVSTFLGLEFIHQEEFYSKHKFNFDAAIGALDNWSPDEVPL